MSGATAARKPGSIPAWMILAGVLLAIAGWATRNYSSAMMAEALRHPPRPDLPPIPGLAEYDGPTVESAASLSYIGLGVIVFGAALFVAGLVVVAVRRRTDA